MRVLHDTKIGNTSYLFNLQENYKKEKSCYSQNHNPHYIMGNMILTKCG
jgi:hypothetical protein